jgi:hypothetical protein
MANSIDTSRRHKHGGRLRRIRTEGKVTLITLVAILGLVVLMGFVGNAGHVVTTKVATQNAADAVAVSSAQWMARGMNAVTATNHMLGEVTALVAVMEALGGPEVDVRIEDYPAESETIDKINQQLKRTAPIRGLPTYGVVPPLTNLDERLINFVADRVSPSNRQQAMHKAFATIYDSKLELKRDLTLRLTLKTVANIGLFVPPPWGYISAAVAWGIHIESDYELVIIGKEWFILQGLEIIARNIKPFKVDVLEKQLIPALAAHGDFIAGRSRNGSSNRLGGIVNVALEDALDHLDEAYGGADAAIYPSAAKFRLPIEPEPAPSLRPGPNEPEWGSDDPPVLGAGGKIGDLKEDIDDRKSQIQRQIQAIQRDMQMFDRLEADVNKRLAEDPNLSAADRQALLQEKRDLQTSRQEKQKKLVEMQQRMAQLLQEERELNSTLSSLAAMPNVSGNLSVQHTPRDK